MRKVRVHAALAMSGVTALLLSMAFLPSGRALASDNTGVYICVSSDLPAQCVDLEDDSFTAGQPIYTWDSSSGNGLGWNLQSLNVDVSNAFSSPFVAGSGLNNRYNGLPIYIIEKTTATGHDGCLTATGQYFNTMTWEPCSTSVTDGGTTGDADLWVQTTSNYLISVAASNAVAAGEGDCSPGCAEGLVAPLPVQNGGFLTVNPITMATGYMSWSILDQSANG